MLRIYFRGCENICSVISFLTLCSALRDQGRGTGRNGRGPVRRESWKSPQTVAGSACRSRSARPQSSSASRCLASCCRRQTLTCQATPCCPCCCLARPCLVARTDLRQGSRPPCQEAPGSKCSSRWAKIEFPIQTFICQRIYKRRVITNITFWRAKCST